VPSPLPVVSRRRVLFGAAALAALGVTSAACGKPPPPPDLADLVAQLDLARSDSQLASDTVATAPPQLRPALSAVASDRSKHAQALSDEIARMTGEPTTSSSATATTTTQVPAPTAKDVVAALRKSADSAGQLAAQLSGYRAGLLGSIAASCTAAYLVALA
jgi:sirohydrochlorin ferrochelatase